MFMVITLLLDILCKNRKVEKDKNLTKNILQVMLFNSLLFCSVEVQVHKLHTEKLHKENIIYPYSLLLLYCGQIIDWLISDKPFP